MYPNGSNNYRADPFRNIQTEGKGSYSYFKQRNKQSKINILYVCIALIVFAFIVLTVLGEMNYGCGPFGEIHHLLRHLIKPPKKIHEQKVGHMDMIDLLHYLYL